MGKCGGKFEVGEKREAKWLFFRKFTSDEDIFLAVDLLFVFFILVAVRSKAVRNKCVFLF